MQPMNLPSFLWLWKIAAWSMGVSLLAYLLLAVTGTWMFATRSTKQPRPKWLRPFHVATGAGMATLVILLLGIGVVGTLGYYGNLGHSAHLPAGLAVVALVLVSVGSGLQIGPKHPWARPLHIGTNLALFGGFVTVLLTGWTIVQKYLPKV
jgi:ABC-type amino acid transport system permease subunit